MQDSLNSKKKQILQTAMKLFTIKGYQLTSMQEIAEMCQMSKGSLYLHFKSKEDLAFHMYVYFTNMIEEKLLAIEQDQQKSQRERFRLQLDVLLNYILEYREFLFVQFRESQSVNNPLLSYLNKKQNDLLDWFCQRVILIYGKEIEDHAVDLAILIEGMLTSNLRFFLFQQVPLSPQQISQFIIQKLDHLVAGLLQDKTKPLITIQEWKEISSSPHFETLERRHPLFLLKEMKQEVIHQKLHPQIEEDLLVSIQMMERELMDVSPRRAVIRGMYANIKEGIGIHPLTQQLYESLQYLLDETLINKENVANEIHH